jgi:hypothetical protein
MGTMKDKYIECRNALVMALEDAGRVHDENKAHGSSVQSVAFDSGRYDGLKQAIEILDREYLGPL